jgi:hypothetical protein
MRVEAERLDEGRAGDRLFGCHVKFPRLLACTTAARGHIVS